MNERSERKGENRHIRANFTYFTTEDKRRKKRRETSVKLSEGLLVIGNN